MIIKSLEEKLLFHLESRRNLEQLLKSKNIEMLDKEKQLVCQMNPNKFEKPKDETDYNLVVKELAKKGFSEFRYLGKGQFGTVVLAKHSSTNVRYAIKAIMIKDTSGTIYDENYNQCQSEIEKLKKCRGSPYVVNLIDVLEGNQYQYLILTECLGINKQLRLINIKAFIIGTLSDLINSKQNKRLNELSAIKYSKDIAEGLHYAHSKNCVVSDLKMDNILIDYNGNAVVSDFGLAQNLTSVQGYASKGGLIGNYNYAAPECMDPIYAEQYTQLQVQTSGKPSSRSDTFSLGYLIFGMISGEDKVNNFLKKHLPLQYLPDFDQFVYKKQLKEIIQGLTKFVPRERMPIFEALITLKGIVSIEFSLDDKFNQLMSGESYEIINKFQNDGIEIIQHQQNQFYPIFKNEKNFISKIISTINEQKNLQEKINQLLINESNYKFEISKYQSKIDDLTKKITSLEDTYKQLQTKQQQQNQIIQNQFQPMNQPPQMQMNQIIQNLPNKKKNPEGAWDGEGYYCKECNGRMKDAYYADIIKIKFIAFAKFAFKICHDCDKKVEFVYKN